MRVKLPYLTFTGNTDDFWVNEYQDEGESCQLKIVAYFNSKINEEQMVKIIILVPNNHMTILHK